MISLWKKLVAPAALALAGAAVAGPAAAQDDSDYWSGFYVGANIGGSWADTSTRLNATGPSGAGVIPPADIDQINRVSHDSSNDGAFTGGVEGGYNYRIGENWLVGLETDFGFLNLKQDRNQAFVSTGPGNPTFTTNQRVKTDWMWTVRPRVGYVNDNWMVYATGGMAMSHIKYRANFADTRIPQNSVGLELDDTKTGWTAGAGAAYAISPRWSVKGEYLYASFGKVSGESPSGALQLQGDSRVKANIVRVGMDYRF